MVTTIIISNTRECHITITHDDTDPGAWVVHCSKKGLLIEKNLTTDWFTNKEQAVKFADVMKRLPDKMFNSHLTKRNKSDADNIQ
ncbi:MAG: hypothetical protein EPO24_15490 [Bacteroidetes bacterium]|nr:MAG: hypothetical protein EPO24_15490 [Bacteroidota bacterium]